MARSGGAEFLAGYSLCVIIVAGTVEHSTGEGWLSSATTGALAVAVLTFALTQAARWLSSRAEGRREIRTATRILRGDMREMQVVIVDALRAGRWPRRPSYAPAMADRDQVLRVAQQISNYETWADFGVTYRTMQRVVVHVEQRRRFKRSFALSAFRRLERARMILAMQARDIYRREPTWRDIYEMAGMGDE